MKFQKFNSWINEYQEISKEENDSWEELLDEGVTILYPGSFKPTTVGHLSLIKRYVENSFVKCPIFSKMPFLFPAPRSPICASCICLYLFLISGIILNIMENIIPTEGIKLPNRYIIFSEER